MSKEERNTYTIQADESLGEVKIADEVGSNDRRTCGDGGRRCCFYGRQRDQRVDQQAGNEVAF